MNETAREIATAANQLDKGEFARRYAHPFLSIRVESDEEAAEFGTVAASLDELERTPTPLPAASVAEAVVPVVKREGANGFSFITIGRTSNNDIVIGLNSVSKCHAVIHPGAAGYSLADAGSKNGTIFNGEPIARNQLVPLSSGDVFMLSHRVTITFLDAEAAHALLRALRR